MERSSAEHLARHYFQSVGVQPLEQYYHFGESKTGALHYQEMEKSSWSIPFQVLLKKDEKGYCIPSHCHALQNITIIVSLPSVRSLRRDIQVAWTGDLLHHLFQSLSFESLNGTIQGWDPVSLNIHQQYHGGKKRANYQRRIGNQEKLIHPSISLPKTNLTLHIPFFFSQSSHTSFKLFLLSEKNRQSLRLVIRHMADPITLLRRYEMTSHGIIARAARREDLEGSIELGGHFHQEVTATFKILTEDEIAFCRQQKDLPIPRYLNLNEYVILPGKTLSLKIASLSASVLYWVLENNLAHSYGDLSNYTTNSFDQRYGEGPLESFSLSLSGTKITLRGDLLDQSYWFSPDSPDREGYYAYHLSDLSLSTPKRLFIPPTTVLLKDVTFSFTLKAEITAPYTLHLRAYGVDHRLFQDGHLIPYPKEGKSYTIPIS
jgi:hypothetical protein